MFSIVIAVALQDGRKFEPFASHTVTDAKVVPAVGDRIVLRTADKGDLLPHTLNIASVSTLASMDGYFIEVNIYGGADKDDPLYLNQRRLRKMMAELGWTLLSKARPVDSVVDIDDYEGLENF